MTASYYHYVAFCHGFQEFAGHRDIKSTMLYIHLEKQMYKKGTEEQFNTAIAKTVEEAPTLTAQGWEFVHEYKE